MANIGQSTRAGQKDLPDPCGERRELRRMVQERDEEIEQLQKKCNRQRKLIDRVAALTGGSYRPKMTWKRACELASRAIEGHWMSEKSLTEGGDQS
jgi:hypothetical protein